jgi:hypothetical protein
MMYCAFLSMDSLEDYVSYDHLALNALRSLGWRAEEVSWRKADTPWDQYDLVVIRTTWDYQQNPELFMSVLESIDRSSARLENELSLVRWNLSKRYLKALEEQGCLIVPTLWDQAFSLENFRDWIRHFNTRELIVKPLVSANADFTYRLQSDTETVKLEGLSRVFANKSFMVQPFMPSVIREGEFSLFFFKDMYSHAILKTPQQQDFRVQEEHGGIIQAIEPEHLLLQTAREVLQQIRPLPLYSRIDLVRTENNRFALMEVELIEPSLYFSYNEPSAMLFARTIDKLMNP